MLSRLPGPLPANTPLSHSMVSRSLTRRLWKTRLGGRRLEQVTELAARGNRRSRRDPHRDLGNSERHDFRVRELTPPLVAGLGQEITSRATTSSTEKTEAGVHRGLPARRCRADTADPDLPATTPHTAATAEPTI